MATSPGSSTSELGIGALEQVERAQNLGVVKIKFVGVEITVSKPIFFPEKIKEAIFQKEIGRYKKALPGVDFDSIESSDLKRVGVQAFLYKGNLTQDQKNMINKSGACFLKH